MVIMITMDKSVTEKKDRISKSYTHCDQIGQPDNHDLYGQLCRTDISVVRRNGAAAFNANVVAFVR